MRTCEIFLNTFVMEFLGVNWWGQANIGGGWDWITHTNSNAIAVFTSIHTLLNTKTQRYCCLTPWKRSRQSCWNWITCDESGCTSTVRRTCHKTSVNRGSCQPTTNRFSCWLQWKRQWKNSNLEASVHVSLYRLTELHEPNQFERFHILNTDPNWSGLSSSILPCSVGRRYAAKTARNRSSFKQGTASRNVMCYFGPCSVWS